MLRFRSRNREKHIFHSQWGKNMLGKIFIKTLATETLDDQTGDINGNGVMPFAVRRKLKRQLSQFGCKIIEILRSPELGADILFVHRIVHQIKAARHSHRLS